MSGIKFTSTKLNGTGKEGILKPDDDGYYTLIIGGLNTYNSAGEFYTAQGAKDLFQQSNTFMRRISNGCLKGESGHPKKLPGMSDNDYLNRILTIEESNVCCHFKEIWLDLDYGKKNPQLGNPELVAIMAKVKPSGPKGNSLQSSLDNPSENVCFSIRAFTKDYYQKGQTIRVLNSIVCWDNVVEPGIAIANKWQSPSLESLEDRIFTQKQLERIVNDTESFIATEDSKLIATEALKTFSISTIPSIPPLYKKW